MSSFAEASLVQRSSVKGTAVKSLEPGNIKISNLRRSAMRYLVRNRISVLCLYENRLNTEQCQRSCPRL
jgi:hypothetical protein